MYPLGALLMEMNIHPPRGALYLRDNPTFCLNNPPSPWCLAKETGIFYEHGQGPIWFNGEEGCLIQGARRYMTYADLVEFMQVCSAEMDESLEVDVQVRSSMRAQVEAENARDAEELKQLHDEFLAPSDDEE